MGLFAHGYPSIYRSNMMQRLQVLAKREFKAQGLKLSGLYLHIDKHATEEHAIIRKYRCEIRRTSRWVYNWYRVKEQAI
jgi:hypothetical protein